MSDHRSMWPKYLCDFQFIDVHQYLNYLQNVGAHRNEAKTTVNVVQWYCSETVIHIIPSGSDQIYRASLRKLNYYVYSAKTKATGCFDIAATPEGNNENNLGEYVHHFLMQHFIVCWKRLPQIEKTMFTILCKIVAEDAAYFCIQFEQEIEIFQFWPTHKTAVNISL